jgi:branched-chain amino acid transport system ATP-binding protein
MILNVDQIHAYYGTSHVLFGISLEVNEGEVVCLLGRNGAGKTTTIRCIIGLIKPHSGSIKYKGKEIRGKPPYFIAQSGVGYVPDYRGIFPDLTVEENLTVVERASKEKRWTVDKVFNLFPALERLRKLMGTALSGGQQQMLTIGRTLMTNPRLLLLDEPVEGLAPVVVQTIGEQMKYLRDKEQLTILLSEQNIEFAAKLSNRAYILEKGVIRYHGSINELKANEEVKRQYLAV